MARADWGGASDYSGVFANLNEIWQSRVETATNRAVRQAKEQQAAEDSDTYDKWKNGLLTDEEWLNYIKQRLEASKGDPQEEAEWRKMLREHEVGIRDSQMESSYESGEVSIHALIGYYNDRLSGVEKNSPEYRELNSRLMDLVENRDSDQIYDEAEAIIDRIERGQASYSELLSYYQNKIKTLNPNSNLYRQVKREINSIRDIVDAVGTGGSGGGRSGGSRSGGGGRSGSGGSGSGVQLDADSVAKINQLIVTHRRGGSLYDPLAPDPFMREQYYQNIEDVGDLLNALEADRNTIQALVEYERDNPNATVLIDQWGNEYAKTPEFLHQLDDMMIRTFEQKWAINYMDGNADKATDELLRMGTYIGDHMQRHNSDNMRPAWDKTVDTAMALIEQAGVDPNPDSALRAYRAADRIVQKTIKNFTETTTYSRANQITAEDDTPVARVNKSVRSNPREMLPDADMQLEMTFMQQFTSSLIGSNGDEVHANMSAAIDARTSNFRWSREQLEDIALGDPNNGTVGAIEQYDAREGLRIGTYQYVAFGNQVRPLRVMEMDGTMSEEWRQYQESAQEGGATIVPTFEKGKLVFRTTNPGQQLTMWVDEDNVPVSPERIANMTRADMLAAQRAGTIKEVEYGMDWQSVTMGDGKTWYIDPETGLFYNRMPVQYQYDSTGRLVVDPSTGAPRYKVEPFAHSRGVMAPFAGMSPQKAQDMLDEMVAQGVIDPMKYFTRDENGDPTYENPSVQGQYWSEADKIALRERSKALERDATPWSTRNTERTDALKRDATPWSVRNGTIAVKPKVSKREEDDLAWEARMRMAYHAEKEAYRDRIMAERLSADQPSSAASVEDFASNVGIRIGQSANLATLRTRNIDQPQAPKSPLASLPPVRIAPPADATPELPRPMANSVEMIDRRDANRRTPPPPPPPTRPAPKKLPSNRRPEVR